MGNLANVFGAFAIQGALNLGPGLSTAEFNSKVSRLSLDFVYLGIGVMVAIYLSSVFWIITGERITRRIREYHDPGSH